jgi:hypothetical protein
MAVCTLHKLKGTVHTSHKRQSDRRVRIQLPVPPLSKSGRRVHHRLRSLLDRFPVLWRPKLVFPLWTVHCKTKHSNHYPEFTFHSIRQNHTTQQPNTTDALPAGSFYNVTISVPFKEITNAVVHKPVTYLFLAGY